MQVREGQHEAIEQQKAQCIFCQIIEGRVKTQKVYEDDVLVGILDINPASRGHVLLMPKEHYPIMPLIPPDIFKHLVDKAKEVDRCVKEALLCDETTLFIANGGAAGQQSSHFMLHIIPRERGDGLDMLDLAGAEAPESEIREVMERAGPYLSTALAKNISAMASATTPAAAGLPRRVTKEQVMEIIDANPQLKDIMLNKPEQFKQLLPRHEQLSQLFKDVDVDEILTELQHRTKPQKPGKINLDDALK